MPFKLSKTITKSFMKCPCGFECSSVTESNLQLLYKLHSKKCEISAQRKFNKSNVDLKIKGYKNREIELNKLGKRL